MTELSKLYDHPLPANRKGSLYNAFPYPTKISPEAIALYIACHTKVGDTVLDPFSGSGTTGLATLLCDQPTLEMKKTAHELGVKPLWGKRKAILFELGSLGSFVSNVMCNPPTSSRFNKIAQKLITDTEEELKGIYEVSDPEGNTGTLRYAIWSEILICPKCQKHTTYWDNSVRFTPLMISSNFNCPNCQYQDAIGNIKRLHEEIHDPVLSSSHLRKKRVPVRFYGRTVNKTWARDVTESDRDKIAAAYEQFDLGHVPVYEMKWGILYRKGYHSGISHVHHFYTDRNLIVFSRLWKKAESYPQEISNALKLLLLSYNATHSTLMSRVVVKKNNKDFVITGAQSGVLYISNLPVEKNIFDGLKRKIKTFTACFEQIEKSQGSVEVFNQSSTEMSIPDESVDYVFTDPPFGDYIPYSEINQINEAWLDRLTCNEEEVIVNTSQQKGVNEYRNLMSNVFSETRRVLKPEGKMSLVFHSAKAEIWQALVSSFKEAGFRISLSSILDKVQGSFKQVTSTVKVQGDPLLLLIKSDEKIDQLLMKADQNELSLIREIIDLAYSGLVKSDEKKPERLFSRYVTACLEAGIPVSKNAKQFQNLLQEEVLKFQTISGS